MKGTGIVEQAQALERKRALTIINLLIAGALVVLIVAAELLQAHALNSTAGATSVAAVGPLVSFGGALSYAPPTLTVRAGQAVEWRGPFAEHPLLSVDGLWQRQASGDTFSHTFDTPGTYRYYCQLHGGPGSGMAGTVVVQ
jgi:plastocyanin